MLANQAVYTFLPLATPASPLAGQGLRHKLKRRTSVVFDVKMMEDHVYVVVDEEDLVKSHLLLAVREEVDVLKANISKLVDKISVLERENEVLKTNASPEVLAQLEEAPPAGGPPTLVKPARSQPASQPAGH